MAEKMEDAVVPPGRFDNNNATPTRERAVASYPARRGYKPYIQTPPKVHAVEGMIDIHCHAEHGQQDCDWRSPSSRRKAACMAFSTNRSARKTSVLPDRWTMCDAFWQELDRWSDETGIAPIKAWGGYALCRDGKPPSREKVDDAGQGRRVVVLAGIGQSRQHLLRRRRKDPALGSDGRSQGALGTAALGFGAEVRTLCALTQRAS